MDQIFDRLGNLLKSILQDDDTSRTRSSGKPYGDKDMQDAWEELDSFLNEGEEDTPRSDRDSQTSQQRTQPGRSAMPQQLKTDYANLEVPPGSSMEVVRKNYKRLLVKYHPDRHASDPERFETATRVTQKINESFQRIKKYDQTGTL